MAKNWTIKEATQEFMKGNKEAIADIGRRFPLLSYLLAGSLSGNVGAIETLLKSLPDNLTCNKVNGLLKSEAVEEVENDEEENEQKDSEVVEDTEVEDDEAVSYESMTSKELSDAIKSRKLSKVMKERFANKWNKVNMIACLKENDGETDDDEKEEEQDESEKYDGMSAPELFKECKKRGLKVRPKQSADFYIEKLEEDDRKQEAEAEDEDDDWGEDDEEVVEKPKKSKADKKPAKKAPAKKVVEEDDDDEDWDI